MDLREYLDSGQTAHWYSTLKARLLVRLVKRLDLNLDFGGPEVLVDLGSGSGFLVSEFISKLGIEPALVVLVDPGFPADMLGECVISGIAAQRVLELPDLSDQAGSAMLLAADVLEHVEEPSRLLSETLQLLPVACLAVITVPAFRFLWSDHDVRLGHFDRFTKQRLIELIGESELVAESAGYMFQELLPGALLRKLVSNAGRRNRHMLRRTVRPSGSSRLGSAIVSLSFMFGRISSLPGLTVFALASRNEDQREGSGSNLFSGPSNR